MPEDKSIQEQEKEILAYLSRGDGQGALRCWKGFSRRYKSLVHNLYLPKEGISVTPKFMRALGPLLKEPDAITRLCFDRCLFDGKQHQEYALALLKVLKEGFYLKHLLLDRVILDDKLGGMLADILSENKTLEELFLFKKEVHENASLVIARALESNNNSRLKHLYSSVLDPSDKFSPERANYSINKSLERNLRRMEIEDFTPSAPPLDEGPSFKEFVKNRREALKLDNIQVICSIKQGVMDDPVMVLETGQIYERCEIVEWLSSNNKDPNTNQNLSSKELVSCYGLKQAINAEKMEYAQEYPAKYAEEFGADVQLSRAG